MRRKFLISVTSIILSFVAASVNGDDFRIVLTESGVDSLTTETSVLIAGGDADGLESGMEGPVFSVKRDNDTVVIGSGVITDVGLYESWCFIRVSGKTPLEIGHRIALKPPERDQTDLIEKGREALDKGDFERAEFFLSAVLDSDSSELIAEIAPLAEKAKAKVDKEFKRKLLKHEREEQEKKTQAYLAMAAYYALKGSSARSEHYLKKLRHIYPKDRFVNQTIESIEELHKIDLMEAAQKALIDAGPPSDLSGIEIHPEMIEYATPEYPYHARKAGLEGVVWVEALVNKAGIVISAMTYKSSGYLDFDNAAVIAAYRNKFKPGIDHGKAINCWVCYKVSFELDP